MVDTHRPPRRLVAVVAVILLLAPVLCRALDPEHPAELTPLWEAEEFPRCTARELALAGYPDAMHIWGWPDWQVMTDADGRTYGPGSLCDKKELQPHEGLLVEPGHIASGHVDLRFNEGYKDCDLMIFVEITDWAVTVVSDLLALSAADTLRLINPDNTEVYQQISGQGTWRLFQRRDDGYLLQPIPILMNRTLDGHAGFMVAADWILAQHCGDRLPPWLHLGLLHYLSENGVHLNNYVAQFRNAGPILLSPPLVDAIITQGIDPDPARDREMYRRAAYSAFLMVWQLVENEGGLQALQDFLGRIVAGEDLDEAAVAVYGVGLSDLADMIDPVSLGEPIGKFINPRRPHIQP